MTARLFARVFADDTGDGSRATQACRDGSSAFTNIISHVHACWTTAERSLPTICPLKWDAGAQKLLASSMQPGKGSIPMRGLSVPGLRKEYQMSSNQKFTLEKMKALLGPPPLIKGESEEAYSNWWGVFVAEFEPESRTAT
jgi:hypothetical protein